MGADIKVDPKIALHRTELITCLYSTAASYTHAVWEALLAADQESEGEAFVFDVVESPWASLDLKKQATATWKSLRKKGISDLHFLWYHIGRRADELQKERKQARTEKPSESEARYLITLSQKILSLGIRFCIAKTILDLWAEDEEVPAEIVFTEEQEKKLSLSLLHPRVREYAHVAAPYLENSEFESVRALGLDVAEEKGVEYNTAYKWLCRRNPLYDANKSTTENERYHMLKESIVQITQHGRVGVTASSASNDSH